jgi:3-oxoacyl-[acyl-carrier protein] reductase
VNINFINYNQMNIIINGGTRGIGRKVVDNLSKDPNNQIFVTGRNENILKDISSNHENVRTFSTDMSLFDNQAIKFEQAVLSFFKKTDILINLAGFLIARDFNEMTSTEGRLIMETNFFGPASLIRILRPHMNSGSHIVNISSMGGFQGSVKFQGLSYYSASKAAIACLTECLALEYKEYGISVNCLALGAVQTEMLNEAFPGYKAPVDAEKMADFISEFALTGNKFFNGKILPVAMSTP